MKTFMNTLEEVFTAITYAEEGVSEDTGYTFKEHGIWDYLEMQNAIFAAEAFAEIGDFDIAREIFKGYLEKHKYESAIFQKDMQVCCLLGK